MYALVDCNNFFVSCERVFRPGLEGKAVVVLSNNDGCVISRSNESKALGIRMCAPFYQIRHLAESGKVVACSSNRVLYADLSERVMSILADAVPKIEIYSIDEAFLVLDGIDRQKIPSLCRDLIERIRKWVGIPVSIGVAPTKTLAKIASHFAKSYKGYKGLCMIDSDEKRCKALALTPIRDVWGIGRKLSGKMSACGISTAKDFVSRPPEWVKERFMLQGIRTWSELQGNVCVAEELPDKRKSICVSRSFAGMIEDEKDLSAFVSDFASKCARQLRKEHSAAGEVRVSLFTNRFRDDLPQYYPSVSRKLPVAANSSQEIVSASLSLLHTVFKPGYRYKRAGVVVDDIVDADAVQIPIFGYDPEQRKRHDRISEIMDNINSVSGNLVHLAASGSEYALDSLHGNFRSRHYTTSLDDIIEIH